MRAECRQTHFAAPSSMLSPKSVDYPPRELGFTSVLGDFEVTGPTP